MGKFIDLKDQKFGRLTVIERDLKTKNKGTYWICKCSCENETIKSIKSSHLIEGKINSCGCITKEVKVDWRKKLLDQGMKIIYIDNKHELRSTIYDIYNRCYNPSFKHYEYYKSNKYFKATHNDGTVIISNNRREFCRQYNLNRGNMYQVLIGNKQTVKGWTFKWIEDDNNE